MALTATGVATGSFNPACNPIIYTLSSTNTTEQNFRYIADVYVNGSPDYTRIEVVANPTYSSGVVDISGIVQSFLSGKSEEPASTFNTNDNHLCSYVVQFGEQYGASSGITTYPDITSKSACAYNAAFDPIEFLSYNQNDWIAIDSGSNFLTDNPRFDVTILDPVQVTFLNNALDNAKYLEISSYEADGSFADTVRILNPYNSVSANNQRSIILNVGFDWLDSLVTADFVSGSAPFMLSDGSYTVKLLDSAFADASETLTFYLVTQCSKSTPIRFKFMNKYGAYDHFTFTGANKKNTEIKKNVFKSNNYTWSSSGYSTNSRARGRTQFETTLNDVVTVVSDWLTEDQSTWLEQLVASPDVYVYEGSNLIAVEIVDSRYEPKQESIDQLFNLTVSFRYNYSRTTQRR